MRKAKPVDQTEWKEKLINEFGISRGVIDTLSDNYFQMNFEVLYKRLQFLPRDSQNKINLDDFSVFAILGSNQHSRAYRNAKEAFPEKGQDSLGNTALHYFALCGDGSMVRYLIGEGCRLDTRNSEGQSVFNYAVFGRKYSQNNIDRNFTEYDFFERSIYHDGVLKQTSIGINAAAFEYLLEKEPKLIQETHDRFGTPLHWAAAAGDRSTLEFMVKELRLDPNAKDAQNRTILDHAMAGPEKNDECIAFCKSIMLPKQAGNSAAFFQAGERPHVQVIDNNNNVQAPPPVAPSPYSKKLQEFIYGIKARKQSYPAAFAELQIDTRDELCCNVSLNVPEIPVTLDGRLYDLNILMALPADGNGERSDPITKEKFMPSEIQPARMIKDMLEADIKKATGELPSQSQLGKK